MSFRQSERGGRFRRSLQRARWVLGAVSLLACSDESPADGDDSESAHDGPVYAFKRYVPTADDEGSMYVHLSKTLDVAADSFDDEKGREVFGDVVTFGTDYLFSNDGERITKYEVDDDLSLDWRERGVVSFANYPLTEGANFFFMTAVDEHTVYMQIEGSKRLVWDPLALEVERVMENSEVPQELEDLPLHAAGNGNGIRFKGAPWLLYSFMDEDWWRYASKSYAVTYDTETHEESNVLEIPCPGIDTATQDDEGNTYLSSGSFTGILHQYGMGPKPCIAKLTSDGELDESWTTDLVQVTGGRFPTMLEYARDGWAFVNVLHHEKLGLDFDSEIPDDLTDVLWRSENWKVWLVNLDDMTGHPLEELGDQGGFMGQGAVRKIDGRVFLTIYDNQLEKTKIFELLDDATLEEIDDFHGEGAWYRLR